MARRPKTYEELRAVWDKKLKASGFEDIETRDGRLKEWSSTMFGRRDGRVLQQGGGWRAKQDYYRMATFLLNDYAFESRQEQITWEYHANGMSISDIVETLRKLRFRRKVSREAVRRVIKRLRVVMFGLYLEKSEDEP